MLSFEFLLQLSAILKLDFLKSPGISGSARSPRGILGNRATNNFLQIYFVTLSDYANEVRAN